MTHMPIVLVSSPQVAASAAPPPSAEAPAAAGFAGMLAAQQGRHMAMTEAQQPEEGGVDVALLEGQVGTDDPLPLLGLPSEAGPVGGQFLPLGGKALPPSQGGGVQASLPASLITEQAGLAGQAPLREPGPQQARLLSEVPGEKPGSVAGSSQTRNEALSATADLARPPAAAVAVAPAVASEVGGDVGGAALADALQTKDIGSAERIDISRLSAPRSAQPSERPLVQFAMTQSVFDEPAWGQAMAARIQWMGHGGVGSAKLRLNPEELGGIQVQLSIQGDKASVQFQTQYSETREIIERLMPRLSQAMETQGLRLEDVKVSHQSSWTEAQLSQQDQQFARGRQEGAPGFASRADQGEEEGGASELAPPMVRRSDSAVDDYA